MIIRERIRPYIHLHLRKASKDGTPLMRPLFYDYPAEEYYDIFDQYMFGPDIMVCPIYEASVQERDVVLPKGADWIDAETGVTYKGGQRVKASAPLKTIPVFLRKGTDLTYRMFC